MNLAMHKKEKKNESSRVSLDDLQLVWQSKWTEAMRYNLVTQRWLLSFDIFIRIHPHKLTRLEDLPFLQQSLEVDQILTSSARPCMTELINQSTVIEGKEKGYQYAFHYRMEDRTRSRDWHLQYLHVSHTLQWGKLSIPNFQVRYPPTKKEGIILPIEKKW